MDQIHILVVDDSEADTRILCRAISSFSNIAAPSIVNNGDSALDFLYKRNGYQDAQTPDLILLDLNLPRLNGQECLSVIKQDTNLKHIPVIIFTTSSSKEDVTTCYQLHANAYMIKPDSYQELKDTIESIKHFWSKVQ